jgi:hyperosmotically inducible protein
MEKLRTMHLNFRKSIAALIIITTIPGCIPVAIGGAVAGGYLAGTDSAITTGISDATITTTIKTLYLKDDLVKARDIKVETSNGIVNLRGYVDSTKARERAISLAYTAKGVKKVNSKFILN